MEQAVKVASYFVIGALFYAFMFLLPNAEIMHRTLRPINFFEFSA